MESMDWRDRIDLDGIPRLRAVGVHVEEVVRELGRGVSVESLLSRIPGLTRDDVLACLAYAAEQINRTGFVESTRRGLADTEAGRLVDDEDVWAELDPDAKD